MLTSSLQSTWESQRSRQAARPKYGANAYGANPSYEEVENKMNDDKLKMQNSSQQGHFGRTSADASNGYGQELPNLKFPQGGMNRGNLGLTGNYMNNAMNGNQLSPRSAAAKDILGVSKKNRSVSRHGNTRNVAQQPLAAPLTGTRRAGNRYDAYGPDALSASLGKTSLGSLGSSSGSDNVGSNGNNVNSSAQQNGYFPQIANNNAVSGPSLGATAKRTGLAHAGLSSLHGNNNNSNISNASVVGTNATALTSSTGITKSDGFVVTEEHHFGAVTSIRGLKPGNPNWINQDNFVVIENFEGRDTHVFGVLDGHGENGHHVSRRCRENFPHFMASTNLRMDLAFNMMHNDLTASEIDVRCSGATCVMAVLQAGKLVVYNCGDSRAVLGRRAPNGSVVAQAMSNDHKPDKPEERKRILSCGGHLGCRQVLVNQGNRGPVSMPVGPCRVWYQHRGETLGLAMSRSLGDAVVHKFGVSAEPESIEHSLDDSDEFLIIATDGIWDVVDNNHAVQMVHNIVMRSSNWSALEASSVLVKFARSRWEKLSPMIDDITCVVVKLKS